MNVTNYERQLFNKATPRSFILPWGYVLLQNMNKNGDLLLYENFKAFRQQKVPVWILLKVLIFRNGQNFIPVYSCPQCEKMKHLETLTIDQRVEDLNASKCIHSLMADIVVRRSGQNWEDHWPCDLSDVAPQDQAYRVSMADHIHYQTLLEEGQFLAVLKTAKFREVSVLSTFTITMKKPACSNCAVRICKCFFSYKKLVNTEEADQDTGIPASHYWDRNQREAAPDDN